MKYKIGLELCNVQVLPLARVALSEEERRAKVANLEEATRKLELRDEERQQLSSQVTMEK